MKSPAASTEPSVGEAFIRDLEFVHEAIRSGTFRSPQSRIGDLSGLEALFRGIRSRAVEKLGGSEWVSKLESFDPLLNPVGLFGTIDLGLRETAHTNTLAWLLNPGKEHGFGAVLTAAFLQEAMKPDSLADLRGIHVDRECIATEREGRLDVLLSGTATFGGKSVERFRVIVEAKIEAGEGDHQCQRYEQHVARTRIPGVRQYLVFLTTDGREPATGQNSSDGLWRQVSFLEVVTAFRRVLPTILSAPGFPFLRLYMTSVLKDLYGFPCGSRMDEADPYLISRYLGCATS